jgi:hypothetical protein
MAPALAVDGQIKSIGVQPVGKVKEILAAANGAPWPGA